MNTRSSVHVLPVLTPKCGPILSTEQHQPVRLLGSQRAFACVRWLYLAYSRPAKKKKNVHERSINKSTKIIYDGIIRILTRVIRKSKLAPSPSFAIFSPHSSQQQVFSRPLLAQVSLCLGSIDPYLARRGLASRVTLLLGLVHAISIILLLFRVRSFCCVLSGRVSNLGIQAGFFTFSQGPGINDSNTHPSVAYCSGLLKFVLSCCCCCCCAVTRSQYL